MADRQSKKILEKLKQKYNVSELWSFSKYNSFKTDPYGWMLKYIKHEPETRASIWGVSGGNIHDIIQDFYDKKIKYEDMIEAYEDKLIEMNLANLKYNRSDINANNKMGDKYENCIRDFFTHHKIIPYKVATEKFISIKISDNIIMQGYIDAVYKDKDGIYNIVDWKSSTIYTGSKIDKEKAQLVLYAESLIQRGIPIDKIKIKWNFLKYYNITYQLKGIDKETKTHKTKTTNELRIKWIDKIENNLRMWLKEYDYNELEIENMINIAKDNNSLNNIPTEISEKYNLDDCYVEIELNQDVIDCLKADIIDTVADIEARREEYNKYLCAIEESNDENEIRIYQAKADKVFWTNIDATNEFYFANLCGYSAKQHKPYKEYLNDLNLWNTNKDDNQSKTDTEDDNWLNLLD